MAAFNPAFGENVPPNENQPSSWYSIPLHFTDLDDVLLRAVVFGDGALDPAITYITLDAR